MNIRRAKIGDAERIKELLYQVGRIHAEARPDIFKLGEKKYSDNELMEIIQNDKTPIFVYCDEDNVVLAYAFCIYKITESNILLQDSMTLYIDDLCVDEKHRRCGIGKALYDYVLSEAKKNSCDSVTLNVWSFNEKAVDFYKKCGLIPQRTIMEKKL